MSSKKQFMTNSLYDDNVQARLNLENDLIYKRNMDTSIVESNKSCFLNVTPFSHVPFRNIPGDLTKVEDNLRGYSKLSKNRAVAPNVCGMCGTDGNCDCLRKQAMNKVECVNVLLEPVNTRLDRMYTDYKTNRFTPLYDNPQSLDKITNNRIGINTRLAVKDKYAKNT